MNIHRYSHRIVCPFNRHILFVLTALMMSVSPATAAPPDASQMAVQVFEAVLGDLDLDVAATIVAAGALLHTPDGDFVGYEGTGQFAASLRESFSEVAFVTQEPVPAGDVVTLRWTMTGVHTGTYQGLVPIGAPVSLTGLAVLRFDEAAIVEQWIVYDRLALVEQIQAFTLQDACGADCLRPNGNR